MRPSGEGTRRRIVRLAASTTEIYKSPVGPPPCLKRIATSQRTAQARSSPSVRTSVPRAPVSTNTTLALHHRVLRSVSLSDLSARKPRTSAVQTTQPDSRVTGADRSGTRRATHTPSRRRAQPLPVPPSLSSPGASPNPTICNLFF